MSDLEHARELLGMASKDLRALEGMLEPETFADEVFGFHAQQAVEKALKSWIASRGGEYPLTHSIATLLALLERSECEVEGLWELTRYGAFAVQFRYEAFDLEEAPLDRSAVLDEVRTLVRRVRGIVGGAWPGE
jgi:HEPN domain-containing protein